jgi:hypothetical protein
MIKRAHTPAVVSPSSAVAVSWGTGALALQRGGVHVVRNLRARLPNQRESKCQEIGRLTQHSIRQQKKRKGMEEEGHTEHSALVDVCCKGEQAAQSQ